MRTIRSVHIRTLFVHKHTQFPFVIPTEVEGYLQQKKVYPKMSTKTPFSNLFVFRRIVSKS